MEVIMDKNAEKNASEQIALFRYGVVADFVHLAPGTKGLYAQIRKKAELEYSIPGSGRIRIAEETIRSWLKKYRKSGFDGLLPKIRNDKGKPRRLPLEVADVLIAVKEKEPELTVPLAIKKARKTGMIPDEIRLPESTIYKLYARHGLTGKQKSAAKDHRRFAWQYAGDLFMADVMHGPSITEQGNRKRKTYLIAFIDDATRVIPYAEFAFSENTAAFMKVFKDAILRRGIPTRLFVDNGSAFRSTHLRLICAKLGITLIHARAYHAESKGKIERWFRTIRLQFLPILSQREMSSLEAINRALWMYIEIEYHRTPHRILGETPLDRWAKVGQRVRYPEPGVDLDDLFLFEAKRKVQKDRTVSLNGVLYEVDASLVGETVTLRYDPADQGDVVEVCHKDYFPLEAKKVDVYANCFVKRDRPSGSIESADAEKTKAETTDHAQPKIRQPIDFSKLANTKREGEDV
jgi:transposase InsO family protein